MPNEDIPMQKCVTDAAIQAFAKLPDHLRALESVARNNAAATLAAAIISAAGRPVSVHEALEVQRDIQFSMYGGELKAYEEWVMTKNRRLRKPFD
jgi:hypothetical protein